MSETKRMADEANRMGQQAPLIAAAYQLGHKVLGSHYWGATLIHVNDVRGHAAVLGLFDEVIVAG